MQNGENPARLSLPQITLCAVSSVNVAATIHAMEASLEKVDFGAAKLFTDADIRSDHPDIIVVPIARLTSSAAYSDFLLSVLADHIETSHCLVVQWDGYVLDARRWRADFLTYDYIGASWPQFDDGHDVGNGGFSLRSRKLMNVCRDPAFQPHHLEDVAIGRINRSWLESQGIRFAPTRSADLFSTERSGDLSRSFGFHGAWLMPRVMGLDAFWRLYLGLDDRHTIRHDFLTIVRQFGLRHWKRAIQMIMDQKRRPKR